MIEQKGCRQWFPRVYAPRRGLSRRDFFCFVPCCVILAHDRLFRKDNALESTGLIFELYGVFDRATESYFRHGTPEVAITKVRAASTDLLTHRENSLLFFFLIFLPGTEAEAEAGAEAEAEAGVGAGLGARADGWS